MILIFNENVSFGRMEHFHMKIIMRRVSMIFHSENHRYDNAARRCLPNRIVQFYWETVLKYIQCRSQSFK